jgi:hypothetical protein
LCAVTHWLHAVPLRAKDNAKTHTNVQRSQLCIGNNLQAAAAICQAAIPERLTVPSGRFPGKQVFVLQF